MSEKEKDPFDGKRPRRLVAAVSYVETDFHGRCVPRVYMSSNETIWVRPGEDAGSEIDHVFEMIEEMLVENAKRGRMCFLARNYFFLHQDTPQEAVEKLKGTRFNRDQIRMIRRIADECEHALDKSEIAHSQEE